MSGYLFEPKEMNVMTPKGEVYLFSCEYAAREAVYYFGRHGEKKFKEKFEQRKKKDND